MANNHRATGPDGQANYIWWGGLYDARGFLGFNIGTEQLTFALIDPARYEIEIRLLAPMVLQQGQTLFKFGGRC